MDESSFGLKASPARHLNPVPCLRRQALKRAATASLEGHDRIAVMQHRCPICKTPTDSSVHSEFPFCSERCRERDLGNWATEKYVVSEPVFDEDDEDLNESPNPDDTH
jgi:uncharacterized protein